MASSTMDRQQFHESIQQVLDGFTKDPQKVPGVVVAFVDKDGELVTANASGSRSLKGDTPMDLDTVFWIASCTKLMTAMICLQLVEKDKVKLDDAQHLYQYCPELQSVKVLQSDGSLVDKKHDITLRMLLSHTSGFGYEFFNEKLRDYYLPVGFNIFDGDRSDYINMPLVNQPGERWEYGIGIDWAGFYCERVTGMHLNDLMMENIIAPLGLSSTSMFPTKTMKEKLASMHQRDPGSSNLHIVDHPKRGAFKDISDLLKQYVDQSGGAGMFSTPTEYLQILAVLLNNGTSPKTGAHILSPESVNELFKNQIPEFPQFGRQFVPASKPEWTNALPDLLPQQGNPDQGWSLGMHINIQPGDTGRSSNSGCWAGIANLFYVVDREKGVAGMIASQILPFADMNVLTAWFLCEQALYKALGTGSGARAAHQRTDSLIENANKTEAK